MSFKSYRGQLLLIMPDVKDTEKSLEPTHTKGSVAEGELEVLGYKPELQV